MRVEHGLDRHGQRGVPVFGDFDGRHIERVGERQARRHSPYGRVQRSFDLRPRFVRPGDGDGHRRDVGPHVGNDVINGTAGVDVIAGLGGNDKIYGGDGTRDSLRGSGGKDTCSSGEKRMSSCETII